MTIMRIFLSFLFLFFNCLGFAQSRLPQLFLFLGGDKASSFEKTLQNPCIRGVQIIYSWRQLEPQKGVYDFSKIEKDLSFLSGIDKKLFIQIQDRSFSPDVFHVPDYIRLEKAYHGGVVQQYDFPGEGKPITAGWVARTWDPAVRKRFQLLLKKLASRFDGKIYGINLPETSIDLDPGNLPEDFSSDKYFYAVLDNIGYLKKVFQKTRVIQYVNFFPDEWNNDHHYMSRLFAFARNHHIGLGGPDVVPYKESQMKNSYPFFHKLKGKIETAIAIQEPDYTYTNPKTGAFYHFDDFYSFSKGYLGAFILFWNTEEPFFSEQLLPRLNSTYFNCKKGNNELQAADTA
ncbi:hypothetical protein OQJ02_01040 [Legionella sp. PATHC032]|uniref:hypothetical protein n=1 Tax=Legionella sp. PATHC032 TaxID=2992039 RepID=UPI001B15D308|nr:hypothetical protein [Legionella sp. PATHC032]MCW8420221.1 hypothetical protein [Legionella sp. PATHC032]HAZ7573038.1 hypothetical protein [Legionella pneumophila]HBA1636019.1 hypothetical protein [Legionella pneumophila]